MASTVVCTPDPATVGATVSCAVTCTNVGSATALGATCSVTNAAEFACGGDGGMSERDGSGGCSGGEAVWAVTSSSRRRHRGR